MIINFEKIESNINKYKSNFNNSSPFPHIVIDDFCYTEELMDIYKKIPNINEKNRSRDQFFSSKKYEKSNLTNIDDKFNIIHNELLSKRFENFLKDLTGKKIFIDPKFHGGGIHQSESGSFLDMHTDFNYHPNEPKWFRYLNLLLYINPGWKNEWGGHLDIENKITKDKKSIEPLFNRMVIMLTNDITLHGFKKTNFPKGKNRSSLASYAYIEVQKRIEKTRTTNWYLGWNQPIKKITSIILPPIIILKNKIFGNNTSKNYN